VLDNGICWYLGLLGASCNETCTDHGGVAADAASYVGTEAQGGSAEQCASLLGLLGIDGDVSTGHRNDTDGLGLGCHVFPDYTPHNWWLEAPDFDTGDSHSDVRIVCGCLE
jgi:hypothetical protein